MKTKLETFLPSIDPSVTLDAVSAKVEMAFNSFITALAAPCSIHDRDHFRAIMAKFYRHIENAVLNINPPIKPDLNFDWGRCYLRLEKAYGSNAENIAFDMVRTNISGGVYVVLQSVARIMADEYARNQICYEASKFWESLSINEKISVPKEYIENYGHLIPSELMEGGAVRVRAFFWKVLEEHPKIIKRLRNLNRGA